MAKSGIPIIIAAPSGAGKTTLVNALLKTLPNLTFSISYTTRAKRPSEKEGVDYHFISKEQFEKLIATDAFLEYANVFGNFYGTHKAEVEKLLQAGKDVLFEIDWQGAKQIRHKLLQSVSVFILPPSYETLMQRLINRSQDNEAVITKRMQQAKNEIAHYEDFDYVIVNDNLDDALADLMAIIRSQRLIYSRQKNNLKQLITELLR